MLHSMCCMEQFSNSEIFIVLCADIIFLRPILSSIFVCKTLTFSHLNKEGWNGFFLYKNMKLSTAHWHERLLHFRYQKPRGPVYTYYVIESAVCPVKTFDDLNTRISYLLFSVQQRLILFCSLIVEFENWQ